MDWPAAVFEEIDGAGRVVLGKPVAEIIFYVIEVLAVDGEGGVDIFLVVAEE
jgi:hypothetical protein